MVRSREGAPQARVQTALDGLASQGASTATATTSGEPTWFGDTESPLFGWVHRPQSAAVRGGVIICGPLGKQYDTTYYTLRVLAERLAARGFVALRFDYQGTGDSDGTSHDPRTVESWHASVTSASHLLASVGCPTVAMVGLQLGCLFAGEAAARRAGTGNPTAALVLWDPPVSGSAFLREQRALGALSMGSKMGADGAFESPGQAWTGPVVDDLRMLALPEANLPEAVLVLSPQDKTPSTGLVNRLNASATNWDTFSGQARLYEHAQVPYAAVDQIVAWLDDRPFSSCLMSAGEPSRAAVIHSEDGHPITERALVLGPLNLFGILSESAAATGPTIVLVGGYIYPHTGPGRTWVQLARQLAVAGHRVLRLDLSGIGDSGLRPGQKAQQYYAAEGADDIAQVAAAISPEDPRNVVLVGFCAGAYAVIEAGALLRPRAVVSVNYVPEFTPPEVAVGEPVDPRRSAFVARPRWIVLLRERGLLRHLRAVVPEWGWQLLDRLGVVPSPTTGFSVLIDAGIPTRAVACSEDAELFIARAGRRLARMSRTGRFSFTVLDGVGHSMLSLGERDIVMAALTHEIDVALRGEPTRETVNIPKARRDRA